jgi:hypothetical protein
MLRPKLPKINPGDNIIIGLGDSFTQGNGAYTDATWNKFNGKIDTHTQDPELLLEQADGNWLAQLCRNHMPSWKPVNYGVSGCGNRAAVKALYMHPEIKLANANTGIVIYMMTGLERFDFFNKLNRHIINNFQTMWPNYWDPGATAPELWKAYFDSIYNDKFMAGECLLNLLEVQEFCRSHNFKLIVATAFDQRINRDWLYRSLGGHMFKQSPKKLVDQFDWSTFYNPIRPRTILPDSNYISFLEYLLDLEGNRDMIHGRFWEHYTTLDKPNKYITNCAHPTRLGHAVIAESLFDHIVKNSYN